MKQKGYMIKVLSGSTLLPSKSVKFINKWCKISFPIILPPNGISGKIRNSGTPNYSKKQGKYVLAYVALLFFCVNSWQP